MKKLVLALALACFGTIAHGESITACVADADGAKKEGEERKAFMVECLQRPTSASVPNTAAVPSRTPASRKAGASSAQTPITGPSKWRYSSITDPMTSKDIYLASLESENTINLGFPYQGLQKVTLTMRSGGGRLHSAAMLQVTKGQFQCNTYSCPIMLRADERPAVTLTGLESADHDSTIVFLNFDRVARMLTGTKKLAIAPTFFQNGTPIVIFDVTNFDPSKMRPAPKAGK